MSRSSVRVPPSSLGTLKGLVGLRVADFKALAAALHDPEAVTSTSVLLDRMAAALPNMPREDVRALLADLFAQTSLAVSQGWETSFVAELVSGEPRLELTGAQRKKLRERLEVTLSAGSVRGLARAADVGSEYERIFHSARILTDIRPVFEDPDGDPVGAVVMHSLKLQFFSDNDLQTLSIAMYPSQIAELRAALDRSEKKLSSVNRLLERSDVVAYQVVEDEDDHE